DDRERRERLGADAELHELIEHGRRADARGLGERLAGGLGRLQLGEPLDEPLVLAAEKLVLEAASAVTQDFRGIWHGSPLGYFVCRGHTLPLRPRRRTCVPRSSVRSSTSRSSPRALETRGLPRRLI